MQWMISTSANSFIPKPTTTKPRKLNRMNGPPGHLVVFSSLLFAAVLVVWLGLAGPIFSDAAMYGWYATLKQGLADADRRIGRVDRGTCRSTPCLAAIGYRAGADPAKVL